MSVSMSVVWDRTTEFLSERLGAIAGIAAIALFIPTAVREIVSPLKTGAGAGLTLGLGIMALAFFVLSFWGQLAITALAIDASAGAGDARSRATRRLGALILVWLALLVIGLILFMPVLGILIANGVDPARLNQPAAMQAVTPSAAGLIGIYAIVMLPVGLWLMARIAVLSTAAVVAEQLSLGALGRSFRLTRGLALRIIGVLLLYGIVMWVATLAAETVVGSILRLLLKEDGTITVASVLTALVVAVVATIFSIIGTAFAGKLYLAARDRDVARAA